MKNWIEFTKYGRKFFVCQEGDKFIHGGVKDLCIREGVRNKTQAVNMVRAYKDLL